MATVNVGRHQADQLALQQRQFDADRDMRRRAQAAQVFVLIDRDASGAVQRGDGAVDVVVRAHNTSGQPVYDLSGGCRTRDGDFGPAHVQPSIMPGGTMTFQQTWQRADGISGLDAWLDFRDAAGVCWRITDRGTMTELCGEESPRIDRARCTHSPAHSGSHSWE